MWSLHRSDRFNGKVELLVREPAGWWYSHRIKLRLKRSRNQASRLVIYPVSHLISHVVLTIPPIQSANISKALKNASTSMKLYTNSPRMIPSHLQLPLLHVMNLSVVKENQIFEDSRVRPSINNEPKVRIYLIL
jgi:hypothetical protein